MPEPSKRGKADWISELARIDPTVAQPEFFPTLATNSAVWARKVSVGEFWKVANEKLDGWRTEYKSKRPNASLLSGSGGLPKFASKPEASIRDKVLRLCEEREPDLTCILAPEGPPIPNISDLVRTRVSCSYIDGVDFLAGKFTTLAEEMDPLPRNERCRGEFRDTLLSTSRSNTAMFIRPADTTSWSLSGAKFSLRRNWPRSFGKRRTHCMNRRGERLRRPKNGNGRQMMLALLQTNLAT